MSITFYAVMRDETDCEFNVMMTAMDKSAARTILEDAYPESRCVQLETKEEIREREDAMYRRVMMEEDGYYYEDEMD